MSDVSSWSSTQPPPAAPSKPSWTSGNTTTSADDGDAFDAALRDAGGERTEDGRSSETRRADRRDDEDRRKRRKGSDSERPATNAPTTAVAGRHAAGQVRGGEEKKGGLDILSGLSQHPAAGAAPEEAEAQAPEVDFAAFQAALEQAAGRAETVRPDQTLKILFNDVRAPLQSVQVTRAPDGAISLSLAASADAVPEVSKSLEALRRRLEAKGFNLGALELETESGTADVRGAGLS